MENVTGEQGLLTSNFFHTNPSNFPKIRAAINTCSTMLEGSNLATLIFLTCSFHSWHLFCTMTVFDDWQGHVTVSYKEPITYSWSKASFCGNWDKLWSDGPPGLNADLTFSYPLYILQGEVSRWAYPLPWRGSWFVCQQWLADVHWCQIKNTSWESKLWHCSIML